MAGKTFFLRDPRVAEMKMELGNLQWRTNSDKLFEHASLIIVLFPVMPHLLHYLDGASRHINTIQSLPTPTPTSHSPGASERAIGNKNTGESKRRENSVQHTTEHGN